MTKLRMSRVYERVWIAIAPGVSDSSAAAIVRNVGGSLSKAELEACTYWAALYDKPGTLDALLCAGAELLLQEVPHIISSGPRILRVALRHAGPEIADRIYAEIRKSEEPELVAVLSEHESLQRWGSEALYG